jgi:hypothetical protein
MSADDDTLPLRTRFIAYFCNMLPVVVAGFALSLLGLVITLYNIAVFDGDQGTFVIAVLTLPGLSAFAVATGYVIYRCNQERPDEEVDIDELV